MTEQGTSLCGNDKLVTTGRWCVPTLSIAVGTYVSTVRDRLESRGVPDLVFPIEPEPDLAGFKLTLSNAAGAGFLLC